MLGIRAFNVTFDVPYEEQAVILPVAIYLNMPNQMHYGEF